MPALTPTAKRQQKRPPPPPPTNTQHTHTPAYAQTSGDVNGRTEGKDGRKAGYGGKQVMEEHDGEK